MADREFRIESESPVKDDLMFWSLAGHESLARASTYELTVLSRRADLEARDVLGHPFDIVIGFVDADGGSHERRCQGHAVRFVRGGMVGRFHRYQIRLRSWFWLLTKRKNSRILQNMPVLEILDAVFDDSPITRFKKLHADNVVGAHAKRRYCVQFQESDYAYLSRLLEAEGIYYWFDAHERTGTMYLSDASDIAHEKLPANAELRFTPQAVSHARYNEITQWLDLRQFDSGKYASFDVNYKTINSPQSLEVFVEQGHELDDLEVFEYPGGYLNSAGSEAAAKVHMEEFGGRRERHWAVTGWPDVAVGRSFDFKGGEGVVADGEYLIGSCVFAISHPGYDGTENREAGRSVADLLADAIEDDAVNADVRGPFREFIATHPALRTAQRGLGTFLVTALPLANLFRPPRLTPCVPMPGPQSAIVVGPEGEELHVDKMGRVKVHFHWDRYDESNEKSTCWIRVSQPWAGQGWGGYFAPRIGQEVIVEFMNGDPDRPLITGRVYNDDQTIPYPSATQSGFKTRSTPGGGVNNYNEIMFEDKMGAESISIHAERDLNTKVERNESLTVDVDRTVTVWGKEEHTVHKTQMNHVVLDQTNKFDANTTTTTLGNQTIGTKGTQSTVVNGAVTFHTNNSYTLTTVGAFAQTSASMKINSVANVDLAAGGSVAMGSVGEMKLVTNAARTDATVGAHSIFANSIKAVSNSHLDLMAVGNINQTSNGSNTTVLGANSSGYIGANSEANMGMTRSTFVGLSIDTMVGMNMSACLALQMETAVALKLGFSGFDFSQAGVDMDDAALKMIKPGAPSAAGGGAFVLGANIGAAIGAIAYSAVAGYYDINATTEQYDNASKALAEAATQAGKLGLTSLEGRLNAAKAIADQRSSENAWDAAHLHSAAADQSDQYTSKDSPLSKPNNAVTDNGAKALPMPVSGPAAAAQQALPAPPTGKSPGGTGSKA